MFDGPGIGASPAGPPAPTPPPPSPPATTSGADDTDGSGTVFSTKIAATHKPSAATRAGDSLMLATVCSAGHPNPPGRDRCVRCGGHVDTANPRLVHKPSLATLVTAGGASAAVTDTVLIGRAPAAQVGDVNPVLLPVPSPNSDISRTHVRVSAKDWQVVATDLHSTNGTMLIRPGQPPMRMTPGVAVPLDEGTIIDLGDGATITVRPPE